MKKLSSKITITYKDGTQETFSDVYAAAKTTGLSEQVILTRCNRKLNSNDGFTCRWTEQRSRTAKANKRKGNNFELEVINNLKNIGYDGCVSSRSQSKRTDDGKVDVIDVNEKLPTHLQIKYTKSTPNYFKIQKECPFKDKPFSIIWKKTGESGHNSPGTVAIIDIDFFYKLLEIYANHK